VSVEAGFQQQLADPENAVHRGADFMADVGDEFGFCPRHLQCGLSGGLLRGFGGAAFGDVAHDRLDHLAAFQFHGMQGDLGGETGTVLASCQPFHFGVSLPASLLDVLHRMVIGRYAVGLERHAEVRDRGVQEGLDRVHAEHRYRRRIAVGKAVFVENHHGVRVGFEQGLVFLSFDFDLPGLFQHAPADQYRHQHRQQGGDDAEHQHQVA